MKKGLFVLGVALAGATCAGLYYLNRKSENPITEEDVKSFVNKEKKNINDFAVKSEEYAKNKYNEIKDYALKNEDKIKEKIDDIKDFASKETSSIKDNAKVSFEKVDDLMNKEIDLMKSFIKGSPEENEKPKDDDSISNKKSIPIE